MALGPTWDFARRAEGGFIVDATTMNPAEWRALQTSYQLGELLMPCCDGSAVPKLSPNAVPFFAHAGNGCETSPESQWHLGAKQLVRDTARALGFTAELERPGGQGKARWCADVWIVADEVPFVVELQHSYQHLRDYITRHARYQEAGLRCLWLVIPGRYATLSMAMAKQRLREEFPGARRWPDGEGSCLKNLPVAALFLDSTPAVRGPALQATPADVLTAFARDTFRWASGTWRVVVEPAPIVLSDQ